MKTQIIGHAAEPVNGTLGLREPDQPARLAVVGTGTIGSRHADTIVACPDAALAGVVDSDPAAPEGLGHGVISWSSVDAMLQDVGHEGLDGVIVATPTHVHLECVEPLVDAGIPLLVEKPIAATMEEAAKIAELSAAASVPVLVGHHRRFHEQVRTANRLVQSGTLGDLVLVSAIWCVKKHPGYYERPVRRTRGAGPVIINLVHDIDVLRFVCGEIEAVSARMTDTLSAGSKEDAGIISLRFRSGALGSIVWSDRVNSPWAWEYSSGENRIVPRIGENCVRFVGASRSLDFPNLVLWSHESDDGDWTRPMEGQKIECKWADPFVRQIGHFLDVIRGTAIPMTGPEDAAKSLGVTLAVLESADSGEWVELLGPGRIRS